MRSIESQDIIDKRRKRNQVILTTLLILILLGSTAGYAVSIFLGNSDTSTTGTTTGTNVPTYNGQAWTVNKNGKDFFFISSPDEAKNISVSIGNLTLLDYSGQPVFIASSNEVISQEIGGVIGQYAGRMQQACYGPCNNSELPEKSCSDFIFIWTPSENENVRREDKCVFIDGTVASADAFLYKILGY